MYKINTSLTSITAPTVSPVYPPKILKKSFEKKYEMNIESIKIAKKVIKFKTSSINKNDAIR